MDRISIVIFLVAFSHTRAITTGKTFQENFATALAMTDLGKNPTPP